MNINTALSTKVGVTLWMLFGMTLPLLAQTYTVIHPFGGRDGATPLAGVTRDRVGNLYGTTQVGGQYGVGTVYRMARVGAGWAFASLYSFQGLTETSEDGAQPYARVIIGPDGVLYGTTRSGGNGDGCRELLGCGTVYKLQGSISGGWQEATIHQFGYYDGEDPNYGDLVFDRAGDLFGTTRNGGANLMGAVYELTPHNGAWIESVAYSFGGVNGSSPLNGVSIDSSGNLYGTTAAGGSNGFGVVYRLQSSGSSWTQNVLHSFQGGLDGSVPTSGIAIDATGNLYGATETAGSAGVGTVFQLSPGLGDSWSVSTLFDFTNAAVGGSYRTLIMDGLGNLYGTTASDGAHLRGSVFKLTRSSGIWTYSLLHNFTGGADGAYPYGALSLDPNGTIYGTASAGGTFGEGVVFQITP